MLSIIIPDWTAQLLTLYNLPRPLTDGHSRGEAMRVKYDIGDHARLREGEILYGPLLTAYPLLTMTTGKLIPNDGITLGREGK